MGYGRELPWFLVVALCAALPVFVAVRSYVATSTPVVYIIGSMMALALGLFILAWVAVRHAAVTRRDMRRLASEITSMIRESREERRLAAELAAQVSVLRTESESFANALSIDMNEMRQGHAAMSNDMRTFLERQYLYQSQMQQNQQQRRPVVVHPSQWAPGEGTEAVESEVPAVLPPPRAGSLDVSPLADKIVISLEPVIDLFSGKTAHYRMHYAIEGEGIDLSGNDRGDQRPGLDIHLYREALVLLKRLRKRDNHLNILVPIGAATLASPEALSRLAQLHASEPGVSEGLVVDLPHAVLASLPQSSLEGLAYMARAGIDMSLSNAAVAGLDLAALDKLNVRFVGISAGSVGSEPKQSAGIANFVQAARALHVQVIVTGVANAQQATQLMRVARYASGSAFAEPRRVRRDATGQTADELSAAAE
jgi:EAL domain-containing protein (putative c-di-GMP-specific phosphodiesterase class I)